MSHWYDKESNPRHYEGKDGKPTTLREARKLNLFPSVTTILNTVNKFALNQWMQEEAAMMAAETIWDIEIEDSNWSYETIVANRAWAKEVVAAALAKTMKKADAGTVIHGILENFFSGNEICADDIPLIESVEEVLNKNCGRQEWITEKSFTHELGYGGMVDLHCDEWIIDFKTKDDVDEKTKGYKDQAEQLAAYRDGLSLPNARMANVFISRADPTQVKFYEHTDEMAFIRFMYTLDLWQVSNKFGLEYEIYENNA